ncbi:helix-turn-helix domain-containing protein [Brachybacterium alimentarium]|uniref:helix-turn-helix domain-containing protein n=1 Tax=Brachybacterium alimentarium TaxID=47845 RepID=UPI00403D9EE6
MSTEFNVANLSIAEAAEQLGLTEKTIRRYIAAGKLPAYRVGSRTVRIKSSDLERLLKPIPTANGGGAR